MYVFRAIYETFYIKFMSNSLSNLSTSINAPKSAKKHHCFCVASNYFILIMLTIRSILFSITETKTITYKKWNQNDPPKPNVK